MKRQIVKIGLQNGLEARPVAMLVQVASRYDSKMYLEIDNKKVNAKSIMGMMSLGLNAGEEVAIIADGEDEDAAVISLEKYLKGEAE